MPNDFLQSSPSVNLADLLMYTGYPDGEDKSHNNKESRKSSSSTKDLNLNSPQHQLANPNHTIPSIPPSASRVNGSSTNLSGWTPLISKTYYNDLILPFTTTPNKYTLPPNLSNSGSKDVEFIDYGQGLTLTPFLSHNLNMVSTSSLNHQLSNITPFHDKTLHLADFFMDSPIRQTPGKDLDTITPSKFKIEHTIKTSSIKSPIFQDLKSAQKRSITQVDTPPRQPHKLSISTKPSVQNNDDSTDTEDKEEDDEEDDDEDKENQSPERDAKLNKYYLQTPSKNVLSDLTNFAKTPTNGVSKDPKNFQTPAKPIPASSPSTVIVTNSKTSQTPINDDETDEEDDGKEVIQPPSPTPNKESKVSVLKTVDNIDDLKPAMGVFSEKKTLPVPKSKNKNKSSSHTRSGSKSNIKPDGTVNNRSKMQAGMNKFQIIFTDVHTLMNSKNKKKPSNSNLTQNQKLKRTQSANESKVPTSDDSKNLIRSSTAPVVPFQNHLVPQQMSYGVPGLNHASSNASSQDHNLSINTSKELSMISGGSNTSNLNMTTNTDHSSFELAGLSSTPNGKYFLDKVFEKQSPQTQHLLNQVGNNFMTHQGAMPPPNKQQHPQHIQMIHPQQQLHPQQHQQQQQQQPMMMMMMSTPQHHNVVNYSPQLYGNDMSPSADSSSNNDSTQMGYPYQNYQPFSKDLNSTPQNYSIINLNGQSVMMPVMMNTKSRPFTGMMQSDEDTSLLKND